MDTPDVAHDAVEVLRDNRNGIYLGARYGLTPQSQIAGEVAGEVFPARAAGAAPRSLCSVAQPHERKFGRDDLLERFINAYHRLEHLAPGVDEELRLLGRFAAGRLHVTGSYAPRVYTLLSGNPTVVRDDDEGALEILRPGSSRRPCVVMLHGDLTTPGSLLLTRREVESYTTNRPHLTRAIRPFLRRAIVVVGFDDHADGTFELLCDQVRREQDDAQSPIYVVDDRDREQVESPWPRGAFRHVRMRASEFLVRAAAQLAGAPRPPSGVSSPTKTPVPRQPSPDSQPPDTRDPGPWDVFLSHSSEDASAVRDLARKLRERGLTVWLDREQIRFGDYFTGKIEDGLSRSRYVLPCISANLAGSRWCRKEYGPLLYKEISVGRIRIIPVVVGNFDPHTDVPTLLFDKKRADVRKSAELDALCRQILTSRRSR